MVESPPGIFRPDPLLAMLFGVELALAVEIFHPPRSVYAPPINFMTNEPKWRAGMRALILRALRMHGPQTPQQIAARISFPVEDIAPRMTEMETLGTARDTGQRRSRFGRGRPQKVWEAVA